MWRLEAWRPDRAGLQLELRQPPEGQPRLPDSHVGRRYLGAELAIGDGLGRIYVVEPTGPIEDDPNLTDKKFAGNPTKSYRSRDPLVVTGEVTNWEGHDPDALQAMKDNVERLKQLGVEAMDD